MERDELPIPVRDFLSYLDITLNRSAKTVEQYSIDLMIFTKYIRSLRDDLPFEGEGFDNMRISDLGNDFYEAVNTEEINKFLGFTKYERENQARTRARKLSSLRGFYKYHTVSAKDMKNNPVRDIESPKLAKTLPKFLELDESIALLDAIATDTESKTRTRDYAIVTLFLNCGMRLSELVGINTGDISRDLEHLTVTGKGAKQRTVYLNDACRSALEAYLRVRGDRQEIKQGHKNALFLSSRNQRISIKTVQYMVYKYLDAAGLGYKHLSVHKLRHTAATLMYQTGQVDIRVLKDILGHEQLNTTQIYTHVSDEGMREAMNKNPLAGLKKKKD